MPVYYLTWGDGWTGLETVPGLPHERAWQNRIVPGASSSNILQSISPKYRMPGDQDQRVTPVGSVGASSSPAWMQCAAVKSG